MSDLETIRALVMNIVSDDSGKLAYPGDYDANISSAVAYYSKHRPAIDVKDITGNGAHDYALPTGWVDEFSAVVSIEYPVGNVPETLLDPDEDYQIYQTTTAKTLRLLNNTPAAAETFRVKYTVPRGVTTVPANDVDALASLASALCLHMLANTFLHSGDSTIAADSVDYRDKSYKARMRAQDQMKIYKEHMGIRDEDNTPAASSISSLNINYPGGSDRLTHSRRLRKQR